MRYPSECYQMRQKIVECFPDLRPAQQRGLTLWVYGTILAHSACQTAVIAALLTIGASWHGLRQYLREWLYDGPDKAAPCDTQLDVSACYGPLVRWLLSWWQGRQLALAVDATAHRDQVVVLVVSVLYRGSAIPLAWQALAANQSGEWIPHLLRLLGLLRKAIPPTMQTLVLVDRGLWSPRLWKQIRDLDWHPLMRVKQEATFTPRGRCRCRARQLVPGPGHAWVGRGVLYKDADSRRSGTLLVVWAEDQAEPWAIMTDLPPERIGVCWYGLRVWVELGFRALKGLGWRWQHTRRTDPSRVARHWLVMAVAMLWVMAYGTRVEDASLQGMPPTHLHTPPMPPTSHQRLISVFTLGLSRFCWQLPRRRLWRRLWLSPEPWPAAPPNMIITRHDGA
jgi:hypothetical protein